MKLHLCEIHIRQRIPVLYVITESPMCNIQSIQGQKWLFRTRQFEKMSNEYILQRALSQCQFMENTQLLRSVGTISNRNLFLCVLLPGMAVDTGNSSLKKRLQNGIHSIYLCLPPFWP
jgi:hypothetical protein